MLDVPKSIVSYSLNSIAFAYNGIALFNHIVAKNSIIKAIEFYTNSANSQFQLNVKKINLKLYK